jgi:hypothetical protein
MKRLDCKLCLVTAAGQQTEGKSSGNFDQSRTLHPGDVISTGTPPAVSVCQSARQYLTPAYVVELGINGHGLQ